MQNLPKIVSERLKIAAPPGGHPDPDLLTAFAEKALPQSERALLTDHLSFCADCRAIVFLAQPDFETTSTAILQPARPGWFTMPILRWGLAASCVVILAGVGVLQYERSTRLEVARNAEPMMGTSLEKDKEQVSRPEKVERDQEQGFDKVQDLEKSPGTPAVASAQPSPRSSGRVLAATVPFANKSVAQDQLEASATKSERLRNSLVATGPRASAPPMAAPRDTNGLVFSSRVPQELAHVQESQTAPGDGVRVLPYSQSASSAANTQPVQTPVSQSSEAVHVESAQATTADVAADSIPNQLRAQDLPTNGRASIELKPSNPEQKDLKQSDRNTVATSGVPAMGATGMGSAQAAMVVPLRLPSWSIGPAGILQRSFDDGKTWQSIDVSVRPQPSGDNLLQAQVTAKAKDQSSRKLDKEINQIIFYSVAVRGPEVWAGGSAGALYYSGDAGNFWVRLLPSASGVALSGNVVRIEFTAPHGCRVSTSTGEIWNTTDDGQSWQKQ